MSPLILIVTLLSLTLEGIAQMSSRDSLTSTPSVSSLKIPSSSCIPGFADGRSYRGTVNITISGRTCQAWASQQPHSHHRTPSTLTNAGLDENYCRNPDGESAPWCFTIDPAVQWEFCDVCSHIQLLPAKENSSPSLTLNKIVSATSLSNAPSLQMSSSSGKGVHESCFGRCFEQPQLHYPKATQDTLASSVKSCSCTSDCAISNACCDDFFDICRFDETESDALEKVSHPLPDNNQHSQFDVALSHIDVPITERTDMDASKHPESKKSEFAYLNADGTLPSHVHPSTHCISGHSDGREYRGLLNTTVSGRACQAWAMQYPHAHTRTPDNFPDAGLDDNLCRNPDNELAPWCYTQDPAVPWEYCDICGALIDTNRADQSQLLPSDLFKHLLQQQVQEQSFAELIRRGVSSTISVSSTVVPTTVTPGGVSPRPTATPTPTATFISTVSSTCMFVKIAIEGARNVACFFFPQAE